jgi:hypothetical protein
MEIYDGEEWSEMDIEDLRSIIDAGATIEEAAEFLCRADSVNDVARKCDELGLKSKDGPEGASKAKASSPAAGESHTQQERD